MRVPDAIQILIDAYPEGTAIVDANGVIRGANAAWRQFCRENEGDVTTSYVGANYIEVCRQSAEQGSDFAGEVAAGIESVLGGASEFRIDYPCHSPSERRWFSLIARPLALEGLPSALLMHRNVTAEKLRQQEALDAEQTAKNYAAIVATLPDPVISFDLDGLITGWNDSAQKLYGYERDEIIGKSMEMLYPPGSPKRVHDYLADIIGKGIRHYEATRRTRSGRERTIEVSAAPILSVSGDIVGVSNVHRDLTEQRQAARRHKAILDNLFAFVGLLDLDGTLRDANRAPLEAAGLEPADVMGKKFWDCYWWNHSPDVQDELRRAVERAGSGETQRYDVQVRVAGGAMIWIDFQIAPLRDPEGNITHLIPSGIDISERKALTEALHASNESFRNLVVHSPLGIYTVDSDFRIAHVSDGAQRPFENVRPLIGRDFGEAIRILWPEPFATEAIERFRHTLETGEPYHSPRTVERRHDIDAVESYDWTVQRITMPDGRPGVVCSFYDLSERQRYEEHIGLLMREVNHRAKNLLTVVMSIARQTARDGTAEVFLDRFSQRLLGLSASQDLIVQGNWDGVTVDDLVRSQLAHLGSSIDYDRFRIDGPQMLLSPAAAQGIGMALHELGTNAIKYGALSVDGGTVAIEWGQTGDGTAFRIAWRERNGPEVETPSRSGFGRTVIEQMAAISVGGKVELVYAREGLAWALMAPIERVSSAPGASLEAKREEQ